MSQVSVKGVNYNFESHITDTHKPVYVFLHGFLGSKDDFGKMIIGFPEQYLLLDLLGLGGNRFQNIPEERFTQANQISDLEDIFDALNLQQINLVGYSMGGRLAIAYALKYPDRVKKIYLESTTAGIESDRQRVQRQQDDDKLAQTVMDEGLETFVQDWEKKSLFQSQNNVDDKDFQFMHSQRVNQNPQNIAHSLMEMGTGQQPNHWPQIHQLSDKKVVIITGELDEKFVKIGQKMSNLIDGSKDIVVDGVGHNVHFEDPATFTSILLNN